MVSTSLALAVTVSAWLVPLYLVLMVWILAPARGPHDLVQASAEPGSIPLAGKASRRDPSEAEIDSRSGAELDPSACSMAEGTTDQAAVPDPETVLVKTRRGKGRGRKAAKGSATVEPAAATATWIRVGPGRFVRADGPNASPPAADESGTSESDRSPELELHHDETSCLDEDAREQEASAPDEGDVAIVECEPAAAAVAMEEGLPEAPGLEECQLGPDETSRDQGIALDAFDVEAAAEPADPRPEEPEAVPTPLALAVGSTSPRRWVHDASFVSWRAAWPRVRSRARVTSAASFSGRVVRSGPRARVSPGPPRRPRRGPGRYRLVCRTFPPRSPPAFRRHMRSSIGTG
jgi:hypothetical protein